MTAVKKSDTVLQKQKFAYNNASQMTDAMIKFLKENNERVQKWREQYINQKKVTNTNELKRRISAVDTQIVPNVVSIEKNLANINSLKSFSLGINGNYDHALDSVIEEIKSKQFVLEQTLYQLKNDKENVYTLDIRDSKAQKTNGVFSIAIMTSTQSKVLG